MADSKNQWQAETQNNARRAMALAITIPITLSGKDANGVEFTQNARTIAIHSHGGKIATKCDLSLGSEMTLHNPVVGQTARIRVVWVGEKGAAEEPHEVGVQLVGSENIWGIEFPSYDQLKSALPAPCMKMHSIQRTETAGEDEARLFQEKAEELCRSSGLTGQTNPPDTTTNIEECEGSVEEHAEGREGGLQACRTDMQQLVSELEEQKDAVQAEMGKTSRRVQESRPRLLELAISDLKVKVREEINSVGDELIDLTQKRVQEEVARALEPLIQGALERVNSLAEEQSIRAGERIQGLLSRLIEEGQAQLVHKLQSTTSEFQKEIPHLFGHDGTTGLEESGRKAEGEDQRSALSSFRKALEQECAEVLARMRCELAQALQDITEQAARQASALNDLRKAVEDESLQTLAKVRTAANQAIGKVSGQIERQANACPELSGEVQEESARTLAQA